MDKIVQLLHRFDAKVALATFLLLWITGWVLKAVKGYNFNLQELTDLYKWLLLQYSVDSGLNSHIPWLQPKQDEADNYKEDGK